MLCGGNIGHLGRNGNFVESSANFMIYRKGKLGLGIRGNDCFLEK